MPAVIRHGPRRSLELLLARAAPVFGALLAVAGAVAAIRGLADFGLSRSVYDVELLIFVVAVPVVVLVADTRERAAWLLATLVATCAIAVALFLAAEAVARASNANQSILADSEGEIGTGSFYAALCFAAALPLIARRSRHVAPALLAAAAALLLIGLADKRSTWVAVAAAVAVVALLARGHRRRLAAAIAAAVAVLALAFVVDVATEADGDGTVSIGGGATYTPADGPLDGGFEHDTDGWRAYGNAQGAIEATTDWSAAGARSLRVEGLATSDGENAYAFACGTDATGMAVEPGGRYVATAVINAAAAPPPGVRLGLIFYPGDGSFTNLRTTYSRPVAAGATRRVSVRSVAPSGARIAGITVGPLPLAAGERTSFAVDRVTIRELGAGAGPNLSCGGPSAAADAPVLDEAEGLFGGGSDIESENVSWRLDYWRELLNRLADHPARILAGAGFGPLEFVRGNGSYDFRIEGSTDSNNTTGPHNAFVGALYQIGIFGLIGMIGLFAVAAIRRVRAVRAGGDDWRAADVALAAMLVVSLVLINFTEALRTPELALFVWTVVGLSLGAGPIPGSGHRRPSRAAGSGPPTRP